MEREERRRRIVSRGSDRLALITGQIHSLDPNPLTASSSFSLDRPIDQYPPVQHARSSSVPVILDKPFVQEHHHGHGRDVPRIPDFARREEKKKEEAAKATRPSEATRVSEATRAADDSILSKIPLPSFLSSITPKEINSSIVSSEKTRVICSVAIAVLVVLSNVNAPHKVVKSKSLIAYRPLYVVLMTDVLVVAAKLALYSQIKGEDRETEKGNEDGNNMGGAIKLLELGLVLHQSLRAIFIDCSFYVVIVVCGLSLV